MIPRIRSLVDYFDLANARDPRNTSMKDVSRPGAMLTPAMQKEITGIALHVDFNIDWKG